MSGPFRVDWEDALPSLTDAAAWSQPEARRVVERIERVAALGWSPGRATAEPGIRYLPVPPLGVLYKIRDQEFHVIRVVDPRRLRTLP